MGSDSRPLYLEHLDRRYEIRRALIRGGMAELFLAVDRFDRSARVVLKRLKPRFARQALYRWLFQHEIKVSMLLEHPHLVRGCFIASERRGLCLGLEYVDGVDVSSLLRHARRGGQPVEPTVAAYIVARAAEGLHHAHELELSPGRPLALVHCDVSPGNILLGYDGQVRVCDFGVSKSCVLPLEPDNLHFAKPAFMSPEQATGLRVDRRTDIFSLGRVLMTMLVNDSRADRDRPSAPRAALAALGLDRTLISIVLAATETKPGHRLESAAHFAHLLDAWRDGRTGVPGDVELSTALMACARAGGFEGPTIALAA